MREKQCTCPHHYTPTGLQRYATDACCPVHGAPKLPDQPTTAPDRWEWVHGRGWVERTP